MLKRVAVSVISLVMLVSVGASRADAESIHFTGPGDYSIVNVFGPVSGDVYAGELNWAWVGAPPTGFEATFTAFCIDIKNFIVDPQYVEARETDSFNPVPDAGGKAAWLVNTFASTIDSGAYSASVMAAALQVAIWEVVYDAANSLTSGTFILGTTGNIQTQAQSYLNALNSPTGSYQTADGIWLDTARGQDQILVITPEPATLSLLGLGGCLLLGSWRRSSRL